VTSRIPQQAALLTKTKQKTKNKKKKERLSRAYGTPTGLDQILLVLIALLFLGIVAREPRVSDESETGRDGQTEDVY
jgi:hypothetical protein